MTLSSKRAIAVAGGYRGNSRAETDSNEILCSFHVRVRRTVRLLVPTVLRNLLRARKRIRAARKTLASSCLAAGS
jgi:hypothetical protein